MRHKLLRPDRRMLQHSRAAVRAGGTAPRSPAPGALIRTRHGGRHAVAYKSARSTSSPTTDRAGRAAHPRCAAARPFPDHGIVSEESPAAGCAGATTVWYVDPLDGTTNFVARVSRTVRSRSRSSTAASSSSAWSTILCGARPSAHSAAAARTSTAAAIAVSGCRPSCRNALAGAGFPFRPPRARPTSTSRLLQAGLERARSHPLGAARPRSTSAYVALRAHSTSTGSGISAPGTSAAGRLIVEEAGGRVTGFRRRRPRAHRRRRPPPRTATCTRRSSRCSRPARLAGAARVPDGELTVQRVAGQVDGLTRAVLAERRPVAAPSAPVVKWISHRPPEPGVEVRFLSGALGDRRVRHALAFSASRLINSQDLGDHLTERGRFGVRSG